MALKIRRPGDTPKLYWNTEPGLSEKTAKRPGPIATGSRSNIRPNVGVKFLFNVFIVSARTNKRHHHHHQTKTFIETSTVATSSCPFEQASMRAVNP
jgi:hypothetical protein